MKMKKWRLSALVASLILAAPLASAEPIDVGVQQVPELNLQDHSDMDSDDLIFQGGLILASRNVDFGGFSALSVSSDGREMITLTDAGHLMQARLDYDEQGRLADFSNATLRDLVNLEGNRVAGKAWSDAESLARLGDGYAVAFERRHRIWKYDPDFTSATELPAPAGLTDAPSNGGAEAIGSLPDGRMVVLTEDFGADGKTAGWFGAAEGWTPIEYARFDDYKPTGLTVLPSGDMLVLERFFMRTIGVRARIRLLPAGELRAGHVPETRLLGGLRPPLRVDNFEGIANWQGDDGTIHVLIMSDDNFNFFQQTYLFHFTIDKEALTP